MEEETALSQSWFLSKRLYLSLTLSGVAFALPFFLTHPQLLLGILVNALLLISAIFLPFSLTIPVALMPSLAAFSRGALFGPSTHFLYYVLPFIWFGNLTLIYLFKRIGKDKNYFLALFLAAAGKTTVLFLPTFLMVKIKILPAPFLQTIGYLQFFTAMAGGILAYALLRFYRKN